MSREQPGVVTISVDLTSAAQGRLKTARGEEATITRLLELFDLYEMPATWAASEPAKSAAVLRILASEVRHEIALLGDAAWVGESAGRRAFATELAHRASAARAAGLTIGALVVQNAHVSREHYDLLIKQAIAVVRQPPTGGGDQPRALRHGVWETPPSTVVPRPGAWWGYGVGAARRAIRRAVAKSTIAHLALDVGALASSDPRLQAVENVLRFLARRCGRGLLRAGTLTPLAEEWSRPVQSLPARSILRAA